MNHNDHVNLIKPAFLNETPNASFADFGAGSGAFTLALHELIGESASIYAVDKDKSALRELENSFASRFDSTSNLIVIHTDFSKSLNLPPLDGILMANSLHFFKDKIKVLKHIKTFLKPNGKLIMIEYNVDKGNLWVPYPFSFSTFETMCKESGFDAPKLLATHSSNFLNGFYSAMTLNVSP
ncbi:MAG: class I SAM-dependent methyltransferase [Anaerolineales bacterium]|nr:class I SAM-dependent methyltransferase [Anaerolineales bacterium]